ncbi:unnamed protein product [Periconia digitata]|uniref:Uncharacterized protein n=1 Tax=Periconia digitata TaxID=1303443 RepID=A0A9W4US50_9PLEO|nr:unnamed protein product [Periconia digitata]
MGDPENERDLPPNQLEHRTNSLDFKETPFSRTPTSTALVHHVRKTRRERRQT